MFEKRSLDLVASVQQDLATGETSGGKPLKNAMLDLITVLDNKKTSSDDKLRALLIYIIAMNGVQDLERKRLLETAKISIEDSQCITNLALFDVSLVAGQENRKSKDKVFKLCRVFLCEIEIHILGELKTRAQEKKVKR